MEVKVFLRRSGAEVAPGAHSTAGRHRSSAGSRLGTCAMAFVARWRLWERRSDYLPFKR